MNFKPFFLLILIFIFNRSYSQFNWPTKGHDEVKKTTTIVIPGAGITRDLLAEVFKEYWTVTKYEIINFADIENNLDDYRKGNYSFITLSRITNSSIINSESREMFFSLDITKKGRADFHKVVSTATTEISSPVYSDKTEIIKDVIFIQHFTNLPAGAKDGSILDPDSSVQYKTLIIPKVYLGNRPEHDIDKVYKYPFKMTSTLDDYVTNPKPQDVIVDATNYPKPFITVIDIYNKRVVYHKMVHAVGNHFTRNLIELSNKIKKQK